MFADLKNDFVFRRIFASHPHLTAALLNDLLDRQGDDRIVHLEMLSPEQAPLVAGAKLSILDLKARDQAGRTFVVEMQLLHVAGFLQRVVFNACKTYASQLRAGQPYTALADVVAVSVCDFVVWPNGSPEGGPAVPLVSRWTMREEVSGRRDLTQVQYAFVELPKVAAGGPLGSEGERWAWLLKYGVELDALPAGLSEAQVETMGLAQEAGFSVAEVEAYRRVEDEIQQARELAEEAAARGHQEGRQEGLREGKQEGLREGKQEGLRAAIADLAQVLGVEVTAARQAQLGRLDLAGLQAVREHLVTQRRWPGGGA